MKNKAAVIGVIAAGAIASQGLMPVVAHASTQVAYAPTTISVTGQATLQPEHVVANDPWSGKLTSWVPVYYLQEALKSVGVQATWNGNSLDIGTTPNGWEVNVAGAPSVGNPPAGQMQFSIGAVQDEFLRAPKLVAKDPASGVDTTYIPVYYADLFLQQRLFMGASWSGSQWSLAPQTVVPKGQSFVVTSPTNLESVKPGQTIEISGRLASDFYNDAISADLSSGVTHGSSLLKHTQMQTDGAGMFSESFTLPANLKPGTEVALTFEIQVHSGPTKTIDLKIS
ncbi:hypothetical protein [Alicyclobacillus ferrooxydans]|uniref:hypothetical protein n=1 Tax=Alicyclobacillus ferrooxydans TaxID=471514 RepID=UPI0006D5ABCE|nr:hypothetical protein [Alicyclobacillus ferrooxydans]